MSAVAHRVRQVPGLFVTLLSLTVVRGLLLTLGYARARGLADRATASSLEHPTGVTQDDSFDLASRVAAQVVWAGVFFPGRANCLEQSLTLYLLLRRRGIDAQLQLGVQPYPFVAHAWVEFCGRPINETEERIRHFHPLRAGA